MRIAVIGAGSWGTAVAALLLGKGHDVTLWAHSPRDTSAILETGHNPRFITNADLSGVHATSDACEAVDGAEAVVMVTPSTAVREMATSLKPVLKPDTPIAMLSKGVERESGLLLTGVLEDVLGGPQRIAAMSGPNLAKEVSRGLPAATVVASRSPECAAFFQDAFVTSRFRVYTSDDVPGVEICGAAKNVIAIACGIAAGLEFGDNTAAVIMTRGLAEMSRLAAAIGGNPITCMGLAGMGDLIATCSSPQSRNHTLGTIIANGGTLDDFKAQTQMVAEGATASLSITDLGDSLGVDLPISWIVRRILWEGESLPEATDELLTRPPKPEFYGIDSEDSQTAGDEL